jgi:hypothetical protein
VTIATLEKPVFFFAEMPCVDRALQTGRLVDFYYEHPSHFTTQSFSRLMQRAGEVVELADGYDEEVIYGLVRLTVLDAHKEHALATIEFARQAEHNRATIRKQLSDLEASGKRIAIWGGTGKAAAFIHQFNADAERFRLVVDSDSEKAGTFVPGAGQEILFRDVLKVEPADVVIIPAQWRSKDIVAEMQREGIDAWKAKHDERSADEKQPKVVPGVSHRPVEAHEARR